MRNFCIRIIVSVLATLIFSAIGLTQTTGFNYQGRLTDNGSPANGSFQMQFKLFDSLAGGAQARSGRRLPTFRSRQQKGLFGTARF